MRLNVYVPVSVIFFSDQLGSKFRPLKLRWDGREYTISRVGLHHTYRTGRTLFHIFSVVGDGVFFRLKFNTDNLIWRLEEVSDGQTD